MKTDSYTDYLVIEADAIAAAIQDNRIIIILTHRIIKLLA